MSAPGPSQQLTVLAVDDEAFVLFLLCDILSELGYRAVDAAGGAAGLAALHSEEHVDLLITDVRMPGIGGLELAANARRLRPALPIIYMTGYSADFIDPTQHLDDNTLLLTKPFSMGDLEKAIEQALRTRPAASNRNGPPNGSASFSA